MDEKKIIKKRKKNKIINAKLELGSDLMLNKMTKYMSQIL